MRQTLPGTFEDGYPVINTLKNITTSNPSGYVKAGEAYSAVLTVTSGYMLPERVTVTINGNVLTAEDYAYSSETGLLAIAADKITGSVEIIATGAKKTWRIELDPDEVDFGTLPFGYDVPAAQAVTIKNTGNQPVTVGLTELDFGEDAFVFTQGDGYTGGQAAIAADAAASFTVQPKTGLPVGDYAFTTYTINGSNDTETDLFVNFEVTIAPVSIQTITGVTPPAAGQTPVTTISDTEQYTGTVTWKPVDSPFVHATQYIATITLTPKEGYTLTGVAENFFRVDGASTTNAADSGVITAIFPYTAPAAPTGGYTIDYVNETISIADGHEANTLPDFTGASVSDGIAITPGSTLYIRIAADGSVPASSSVPVTIPARPAAPDGLQVVNESLYGFRDGRITGVTANMEYRASGDALWTGCTEDSITGLAPGTYQVRFSSTGSTFASDIAELTVGEGMYFPISALNPNPSFGFRDVSRVDWFYYDVRYVCENSLMNGTSKDYFSPDAVTTRGMVVTILARMEGVSTDGSPWYEAGRRWAMANNISDGTNMESPVTREQLAAILYRYAAYKGADVSVGEQAGMQRYTDASAISEYAVPAMQWACGTELLQGAGSKLLPKGLAIRAQLVAMLHRYLTK